MQTEGIYNGWRWLFVDGEYWTAGPRGYRFPTWREFTRFVDENTWCCPRDAGG
jgi:hypothetical protein